MHKQILAVKSSDIQEILDQALENGGFTPFTSPDQYHELLSNSIIKERGPLETDPSYKQIIPYMVGKFGDEILFYIRTDKGGDSRLHRKMSIGVGGHIEPQDLGAGEAIEKALRREVKEELPDNELMELNPLGYIYIEGDEVDGVHIGILFVGKLKNRSIEGEEEELETIDFAGPNRISEMIDTNEFDAENWTKVAWNKAKDLIIEG